MTLSEVLLPDSPSGPVVRTLSVHCRGRRFDPWFRIKILNTAWLRTDIGIHPTTTKKKKKRERGMPIPSYALCRTAFENEPIGFHNQDSKLFPSQGEGGVKHDSISVIIISTLI